MERRELNAFSRATDYNMQLALARDLQRAYSSLLAEPAPTHLQVFIDRLCRTLEKRRCADPYKKSPTQGRASGGGAPWWGQGRRAYDRERT